MSNVYLFGAGIQGQIFLRAIKASDVNVIGVIDSYSTKAVLEGIPVLKPAEILDKTTKVYISVGLISEKIKRELIELGFLHVFDFTQSLKSFPTIIDELKLHSLWYSNKLDERVNKKGISQFNEWLSDEQSKALLAQIVRFRTDFDIADYVTPDRQVQYFSDDVPAFNSLENVRFIDAGAYNGDTLTQLFEVAKSKHTQIEYCASFEPDPNNLEGLKQAVFALSTVQNCTNIFVYPSGVWSESAQLNFEAESNTSSKLSLGSINSDTIHCVALDDVVYGAKPNFIKMDIEGAEQAALNGASRIIKDYCPILAICLYHTPADLWQIPALIMKINPNYDMYLRVYGDMLLETVLYCVPKQVNIK
ncbi:FkbM family methyltransferase [Shewanella olleyana]|uniref:FkbM family methyltransferase n=1 Tax=Shewanella olleyana TaxID=135626 RepID=UPI00200DCE34|nr:FkbM family methyltransferase [Shewanella olleyana]MCL1066581.1 FkbM family methyltransferase [Shewanella olleyana]